MPERRDSATRLLELVASNYVRLRWPRLVRGAAGGVDDRRRHLDVRARQQQPVSRRQVARRAGRLHLAARQVARAARPGPEQATRPRQAASRVPDASGRRSRLAAIDMEKDIEPLQDVLTGWDARGSTSTRPTPPLRRRRLRPDDLVLVRHDSAPGERARIEGPGQRHDRDAPRDRGRSRRSSSRSAATRRRAEARRSRGRSQSRRARTPRLRSPSRPRAASTSTRSRRGNFEFSVGYAAKPAPKPSTGDAAPPQGPSRFPSSIGAPDRYRSVSTSR